jgi:acyl-CoA reductase-like NAD-dependent aldehyde dehydrogenase
MSVQTKERIVQNFIGGKWVSATSGKIKPNLNPANIEDILGYYQDSSPEDINKAVESAKRAFPAWRKIPPPVRGKFLFKAMLLLEKRKEEVARTLTREEGKLFNESLGEVQKAINILEFFASEGRRLYGESIPSELPKNFIYTRREPLGVVALITPWNFPISIPVWKMAAALICGNTVVLKPSSLTPNTAALLMEIFEEAGFPEGVVNLVTGSGSVLGEALAIHPDVKAISFTGSTATGRKLQALAGKHGKPIQLEMGGKNAVIVLKDADLELAAEAVALGAFGSTGQRCTATSRVIVEEPVVDAFTKRILEKAQKAQSGPLVDESQLEKVLHYIDVGKKEGAVLAWGGRRLMDETHQKGYFVEPTVFIHVKPEMTIAREEIFGPVLSILSAQNFEEALMIANAVEYGLSSSIFTRDVERVFDYIDEIEVGMVHINSATIGGEAQVPFGGIKGSGLGGREMGRQALEFFTEWKAVYIDYTGGSRKGNFY